MASLTDLLEKLDRTTGLVGYGRGEEFHVLPARVTDHFFFAHLVHDQNGGALAEGFVRPMRRDALPHMLVMIPPAQWAAWETESFTDSFDSNPWVFEDR